MSDFKLGIVRLGKAAGKTKYTLIDERDTSLVENYAFEARLEIDRDGNGATVNSFIYDVTTNRNEARYLHEFIWERHNGYLMPGWEVVHKNKLTMDNRLENLALVQSGTRRCWPDELLTKTCGENSLYWLAVKQLPVDPLEEHYQNMGRHKFYNCNGEILYSEDDVCTFYECHYPPCSNLESEMSQYSICGRCHQVRYCGPSCQQEDWMIHRHYCREKRLATLADRLPDR